MSKNEQMYYHSLCEFYGKIENTTKRLEMTQLLVTLFHETPVNLLKKVIYLTQGKLHPDWEGAPEIGIAEKMAVKAVSNASGKTDNEITRLMQKLGDLGLAAEELIKDKSQSSLAFEPLTVTHVYSTLEKLASAKGPGTQSLRIRGLAGLLSAANAQEARYLIRTVTGTLRLGIADMSILDALAIAFTESVDNRKILERAYNIRSDLGEVASILATKGINAVKDLQMVHGRPIRMMLAQRASSPNEALEKLGGVCACEYKLDGERIQAHKNGEEIRLFSRHLEEITHMYPDIVELIRHRIIADTAIVEGECVAQNEKGELQPFQLLMRRRRKYNIKEMQEKIPVALYLFDILFLDGKDISNEPYIKRHKTLQSILKPNARLVLAPSLITNDSTQIDIFFNKAISEGTEGLILKAPDSVYTWGARSWRWVKLKTSYRSKMVEPVDLVIIGAFWGRGKRAGKYGTLVAAVYDRDTDTFPSITKIATGFSDKDLEELPNKLKSYIISHPHPRTDTSLKPDIWFTPQIVIEVIGDEITHSPIHRAGYNRLRKDSGLAIRFPRFTGRWRTDKRPEDATSVDEIIDMFNMQ